MAGTLCPRCNGTGSTGTTWVSTGNQAFEEDNPLFRLQRLWRCGRVGTASVEQRMGAVVLAAISLGSSLVAAVAAAVWLRLSPEPPSEDRAVFSICRMIRMNVGERIETTRMGNVRVVVERRADWLLHWLRETLDAAGKVVESLPCMGRQRREPVVKAQKTRKKRGKKMIARPMGGGGPPG